MIKVITKNLMTTLDKISLKSVFLRLGKSVWLFPFILTVILFGLTVFRISGSSVGQYHRLFYGETVKDPDLLFGSPQPIRSDEWLVNTQLMMSQSANGFPKVNEDIGTGKDMSFNVDVPYREWSAIFKPQNLAFLVMPFDNAFAFKWWILIYLLINGCYFFTLRLFPEKRLFSAIAALGFAFSPFVSWWYLNSTIGPLIYGFLIMILCMRILNGEEVSWLKKHPKNYSNLVQVVALSYVLICFALILYPPFQIAVAVATTAFLVGYFLQELHKTPGFKTQLRRLSLIFISLIIAGSGVMFFVKTRSDTVERLTNTVYPGKRIVSSGGLKPMIVLTSYLQPQLQRDERARHYYNNQSEASNFILVMPLLLLPGLFLIGYKYIRYRKFDWILISLQIFSLLLLARIFLTIGDGFYRLLFLHLVPNERLLLGIGLIGYIYMLYFIKSISSLTFGPKTKRLLVPIYGFMSFIVMFALGMQVRDAYPLFISSIPLLIAGSMFMSLVVMLILYRKSLLAICLLLGFSFASIVAINPLYRGLGVLAKNDISAKITALSKNDDTWASVDHIYFENFGFLYGKDSLTGVNFYPDVEFWRQVGGAKDDDIYNRYAHIYFTSSSDVKNDLYLVQLDSFVVKFKCSEFVMNNVDFALSTSELKDSCVRLVDKISYPAITLYIYKMVD